MKKLFELLNENLQAGEDTVLVTVVASSGSVPRGAGARMVITKDGRIGGTIGGGAVEYECQRRAEEILKKKSSCMEQFFLHKNQIQDLGMICGGDVYVYFQYISSGNMQMKKMIDRVLKAYEDGEMCWLAQDITEHTGGAMAVFTKTGGVTGMELPDSVIAALCTRPVQVEAEGHRYYCENLISSGQVYIFGGGHVAQALVPLLASVDFRCIVLEDREEFCRLELFPGAVETRLTDIAEAEVYEDIQEEDFICIMTRGHKDDLTVQAHALKTPANYIGVIGSRRKAAGVFAKLKEQGFTEKELSRIKTPIGLEIQAETPAEIAVSIAAELILQRAKRS